MKWEMIYSMLIVGNANPVVGCTLRVTKGHIYMSDNGMGKRTCIYNSSRVYRLATIAEAAIASL
jgi:hypothetical protein